MSSKLVVQMGHVARTKGATGGPGEQAAARRIAAEIQEIAKDLPDVIPHVIGADVHRREYAGDKFVALHCDASASDKATGASVGYRTEEGKAFGQRWKRLYEDAGWRRGFRNDNYTIGLARYYGTGRAVSEGVREALIVEHGFMTNPVERQWIDSDDGTKAGAAAAICAAYPHLDLKRILSGAPEPIRDGDGDAPPSTEPSAVVITVGDSGHDVKAWQQDLQKLLGEDALPEYGADGHFGEETRKATGRAFVELGLTRSWPDRPLVGPRSRKAMDEALERQMQEWIGKQLVAKRRVRFYTAPRWDSPAGYMQEGHHFPTIEAKVPVGGGHQYRVRNSRGNGPYYVTANPTYVRLR